MMRKILALSLVLVMALSFVACDGEDLPSVQEIINASAEAQEDVRTFEFEMEASMDMDVEAEGESVEANIGMDASGAMDMEDMVNIQVQMDATMNLEIPGEGDMDMEAEVYLVDNTLYIMTDALGMMTDAFGMGPTWMKLEIPELAEMGELPEEYWEPGNLLELQTELLEALEIEVTGSERVDGIDCYVLESTPDMEQFWQTFMEMFETMGLETTDMTDIPEDFGDLLDEMFDSFTEKLWIAKDTYLPMKVEVEVSVEVNPEEMGYPEEEGEVSLDMSMTILLYNYNQPVSIELPPEAEDAMDIMDFTDYMDY